MNVSYKVSPQILLFCVIAKQRTWYVRVHTGRVRGRVCRVRALQLI